MTEWTTVLWTDARELARQCGVDEGQLPAPEVNPRAHFHALRKSAERVQAVGFLAAALPRAEAIAWAAACLAPLSERKDYPPVRRNLMDYAQRWIDQPSDEFRRAMFAQAERASEDSPEKLLGYAIFFSGGSISDPDLEPVNGDPAVTGHLVAGAIVSAAVLKREETNAFLDKALDLGEKVAISGTDALTKT